MTRVPKKIELRAKAAYAAEIRKGGQCAFQNAAAAAASFGRSRREADLLVSRCQTA